MTLLSDTAPFLLDECAHAMVAGKECDINLTALYPAFYRDGGMIEIVTTLIKSAEICSDGARTVRLADETLFQCKIKNTGLYLVCCPNKTSQGIVTSVSDDMLLATLRPCENGLTVGSARASSGGSSALGRALEMHFEV